MQLGQQSGLSPRAGRLLLSEEMLSGAWRKGESPRRSLAAAGQVAGLGVQGVSATAVVLVAVATTGETHAAQCRCTRVAWACFLQAALARPETVTSGPLPRRLVESFGVWRRKCGNSKSGGFDQRGCGHRRGGALPVITRWVTGVPGLSPLASLQPRGAPWVPPRTPMLGHPGTFSFLGSDELWQPGECQGPSL